MKFVSYAQNLEDVILRRALKHVDRGFYIDVGANDPVTYSVTKTFYDMGWRGINIDPVPSCFEALKEARLEDTNLQVAVSDRDGKISFFEVLDTGLSTSRSEIAVRHAVQGYDVREHVVEAKTLNTICREHNVKDIHFLSIDVEGGELEVLKGIDLSSIRPWIILIEATLPNTQIENHAEWEPCITQHNYHYVYFDGLNRYYVADEHSELDVAFQTPPNLWDQFETLRENTLAQQNQQLCEQIQALNDAIHQLGQRKSDLEAALGEKEQQRQQLEQTLQEREEQRQKLENLLRDSQQDQKELEKSLQARKQQIQQLEKSLQDGQQQLQQLETELHDSQREQKDLESALKRRKQQQQQQETALYIGRQQRQQLEVSLHLSEERVRQLEASLQASEHQRQHLEASLYTLINSRSMQITAPLRAIGTFVKRLLKWPRLVIFVFWRGSKRAGKRLLVFLIHHLNSRPVCKRVLIRLIDFFPMAKSRLRQIAFPEPPSPPTYPHTQTIEDLSPRAVRVLRDLERNLRKHQ